eukprot:jgi/Tetstr1/459083/TSEL_004533.t1
MAGAAGGLGPDAQWWRRCKELEEYKEKHGGCLVPRDYKPNPELGKWVNKQRHKHKNGGAEGGAGGGVGGAGALGFEWDPKEAEWQRMFAHLKAYREIAGNCPRLLEDIGFVWTIGPSRGVRDTDKQWWEWLALLRTYKAQHGHCRVPTKHTEDRKRLGYWVHAQRMLWRRGRLALERQGALHDVGIAWGPKEDAWQVMFEVMFMCAFKERSGHCSVTPHDTERKKLGTWADKPRLRYNKGRLVGARLAKLEALGFPWRLK